MTHTYAILDVTAATFREIQHRLEAAGYQHAFKEDADGALIIGAGAGTGVGAGAGTARG